MPNSTDSSAGSPFPSGSGRSAGPSLLNSLLESLPDAVIAVDREERIVFWNHAATRFYGYTPDDAIGRNIHAVTTRNAGDEARRILDIVWSGQPWTGEYPVSHRDGSSIPARVHLRPLLDPDGTVHHIVGISQDISAEIRTRAALHRSAERIDLLTHSTTDGLWDWDVAAGTLWANDAYHDLAGPAAPGQSPRDQWFNRIHPEDRPNVRPVPEADGRLAFRNEYRFLHHRLNRYIHVLDRGYILSTPDGKPSRIVGAVTDISRWRDIEDAFHASEERFRQIFEEAPIGIATVDADLRIIQTNSAFARMLGFPAESMVGKTIIDYTHPEDAPSCAHISHELFQAEKSFFRVEKRYIRSDGGILWAAVTATILPGRRGATPLGLALIEDITEQKLAYDELAAARARAETASQAKMRFLAQISHEIRSPMNGVLGMLELIDAGPLVPEQRTNLAAAREAARALLGILEEVLDLTRIEQHRLTVHPRAYPPAQLVREILPLFQPKAAAKNLNLDFSSSPAVPDLHLADPLRVRQILVNLVDNAIKFTSLGSVSVHLDATPNGLHFHVEDTGIGIPDDSLASVFETFSAISAHTNASVGGTGLGLAISQRLAHLMGGVIAVTSRLGEGSRFTLSLPLTEASPEYTACGAPAPLIQTFEGRRVLVVEDNHINQRVAAGLLHRLQCDVDIAANGVEALKMALATPYDAILMDAMMPVMDGFEATAEIRRRESAGSRVPIIGITALATNDDRQRCLDAGMDDYLSKPIDLDVLRAILARWLPLPAAPARELLP